MKRRSHVLVPIDPRRGSSLRIRHRRLGLLVLLMLTVALVLVPRMNFAHPMGNFSISHYAGIRIEPGFVELRYLLDMAEIPTFQEIQQTGIVPKPDDPRVLAYLPRKADILKAGLALTLNGRPLALETVSEDVIFPPGAGNLPTMKVGFVYRAALPQAACDAAPCTLEYRDGNFTERAGWKEIVATIAPGIKLASTTAASGSRSQELANYPTDLINSPPQDLSARVTFLMPVEAGASAKLNTSGTGALPSKASGKAAEVQTRVSAAAERASIVAEAQAPPAPTFAAAPRTASASRQPVLPSPATSAASAPPLNLQANKQGTPRNRFTDLITSNQWGLWFLLTAALIAAALGGLHALEPGHGKTIVAAYLVGSQGTAAHALLLGLIVTATHTAGVYALGLITLYLSNYIVPDHLYPWLGIVSGLTIAALGLYMLRQRYAGRDHGHHHHHGFGHSHHHHDHEHQHDHDHGHDHAPVDGSGAGHTHERGPHAHHHHDHTHEHSHEHHHSQDRRYDHDHDASRAEEGFSYRQLVVLGVTGGIVPCPAALVVLLSAVALHRVAFGLYLIVAFSLGLAAVLISIGMITVYARKVLAHVPSDGPLIRRWLPMASAAVITCLGAGIAVQALIAMGVVRLHL